MIVSTAVHCVGSRRRRRVVAALATCAATALVPAVAAAPAEAKIRSCGFIGFTPNSDDGVFNIVAKNASCTTARKVARAARGVSVGDPLRYRKLAFTCRGTAVDDGLAVVKWVCKRRHARVTFTRS